MELKCLLSRYSYNLVIFLCQFNIYNCFTFELSGTATPYCQRLTAETMQTKLFKMTLQATQESGDFKENIEVKMGAYDDESLQNLSLDQIFKKQNQTKESDLIASLTFRAESHEENVIETVLDDKKIYLQCFELEKPNKSSVVTVLTSLPELNAFDAINKEDQNSTVQDLKEQYNMTRQVFEKMTIRSQKVMSHNKQMRNIEKTVVSGFYVKVGVLVTATIIQAIVFYKLIKQKAADFKRISLPI